MFVLVCSSPLTSMSLNLEIYFQFKKFLPSEKWCLMLLCFVAKKVVDKLCKNLSNIIYHHGNHAQGEKSTLEGFECCLCGANKACDWADCSARVNIVPPASSLKFLWSLGTGLVHGSFLDPEQKNQCWRDFKKQAGLASSQDNVSYI